MEKVIFFNLLLILFTCNDTNNQGENSISKTGKFYEDTSVSNKLYQQISANYKKEYYSFAEGLICEFKRQFKESKHLKRVQFIENKIKKGRDIIKNKRDSLFKLSANKYFKSLNLIELDSVSYHNFSFNEHNYKNDFVNIDKKIFNHQGHKQCWYLSQQNICEYTCISFCSFDDCETNIYLYVIDDDFKIKDNMLIYSAFPFPEHISDFRFNNYIINKKKDFYTTYFNKDSSFSIIKKEYFTLRDTITNQEFIEVGNEYNVTFKINLTGKFVEKANKSFQKEYIEPLYKVKI